MYHTVVRYLGTVAAVALTIELVPGVSVSGQAGGGLSLTSWEVVFLVAIVWSVMTIVIRPVLSLLTLPITILTFGLFSFVLNAALFALTALIVPGFSIAGFWSAFLGALVLSILTWLIHKIF